MSHLSLEQLRAWDHDHLWHPFTAMADWANSDPLVIERGQGVYLYDTEGTAAYLDGVSSLWCNVHGHRHPTLDAALRDQIDRIAHSTLLGVTHPSAIELARELVERTPEGLTRVFFSDDGATAVEVALKMAFQYWRQKPRAGTGTNPLRRGFGETSPTTATPWAMRASEASRPVPMPCSSRSCSRPSGRRCPTATAVRSGWSGRLARWPA